MISVSRRFPAVIGSDRTWAALAGVAAAGLILATLVITESPRIALALPAGLAVVAVVLLRPFVGVVAVVFGSQATGLVEKLPLIGDVAIEGIAGLAIAGLIANSYREPKRERPARNTAGLRLAVLFLTVAVVSALFADFRDQALAGVSKRFNLVLLLWLIVRSVTTIQRLRVLILAVVLSTLLSAGLAVIGYATGIQVVKPPEKEEEGVSLSRQVGAVSMNATSSSRMMLSGAALAAVIAFRWPQRRNLFAAAAIVGAAGTMLTLARSTSMVMALGGLWLLFKARRHRYIGLVLVFGLVIALIGLSLMPAFYWDRLSKLGSTGEDATLDRRLGYQLIGLNLLATHPLIGVGPENYKRHYMSADYRFMPGRYLVPRELHNMYLSVATETGLIGLACMLALFYAALSGLSQVRRNQPDAELGVYAEALQFSLALWLIVAVFGATETNKFLWIFTALSLATAQLEREMAKRAPSVT